jgi:hypothetical protein
MENNGFQKLYILNSVLHTRRVKHLRNGETLRVDHFIWSPNPLAGCFDLNFYCKLWALAVHINRKLLTVPLWRISVLRPNVICILRYHNRLSVGLFRTEVTAFVYCLYVKFTEILTPRGVPLHLDNRNMGVFSTSYKLWSQINVTKD